MANIVIHIETTIDGGNPIEEDVIVPIPPGYTEADTRALARRRIEDAAFELTEREFGEAVTRDALFAAAARLIRLEFLLKYFPDTGECLEHFQRLREIIDVSNDEARARWGELPDH